MESIEQPSNLGIARAGKLKDYLLYGAWIVLTLVVLAGPLRSLVHFALENDDASHILLVPFISAVVIYLERAVVFAKVSRNFALPLVLAPCAVILAVVAALQRTGWDVSDSMAADALALVLLWIAGFALFFGQGAVRAARFSLLFLLLAVPLPRFLLFHIVHALQWGSAAVVSAIFEVTGTPYLREGFVYELGRVSIEIAEECSGIRSSMAVLILALLAAHFYLRSFWKQTAFIAVSLLIMVLKNGVRIATLTLLSIYVNPSFLFGRLHRDGGVVFFLLGMLLLFPVLWALQRGENVNVPSSSDFISPNTQSDSGRSG